MLRLVSSLCPFCEARAIFTTAPPSWQPYRTAATLHKKRPARMILSSTVRRGPSIVRDDDAHAARKPKSRNSPFGGMNVTAVPREVEAQKERETERRRPARAPIRSSGRRKGGKETKDPMHALKMQRALTNISYEKRGRIKSEILERDSFQEFALLPIVRDSIPTQALTGMSDLSPTPIQRIAIPTLLAGSEGGSGKRRQPRDTDQMQEYLLAAETGSGKTLAYVLPVVDALKRAEMLEQSTEDGRTTQAPNAIQKDSLSDIEPPSTSTPDKDTARPRAIILLPTAELVNQVGALIKSLSHTIKFRAALLSSSITGKVIRSRLFTTAGVDIVVTTPHLLNSIATTDPNVLSRVTHLVVDEADSLFDRGFAPTTSSIIDRATPSLKQLILCSATIPRNLDKYLSQRFPRMQRLVTPNLHAIPRRVRLSVVDVEKVPYQGNRKLACAQVVWDIGSEGANPGDEDGAAEVTRGKQKKVVVFVNEREEAEEVATYLRTKGIAATALSRDSEERKRSALLESFTSRSAPTTPSASPPLPPPSSPLAISPADIPNLPTPQPPKQRQQRHPDPPSSPPSQKLPNTAVLVTTDIASRGLDTQAVRHVILYSVPHTTVDFIHRLGRVGRQGQRGGQAVVLVGKGDRRDIVKEVRGGMFRGGALI